MTSPFLQQVHRLLIKFLLCAALTALCACRTTRAAVTPRQGHLSADWLQADISYPAFEGYDALNKQIADYVEADYRDYKLQNQENWQEMRDFRKRMDADSEPPRFAYTVATEKAFEAKRYISVLLTVYEFTGGAHGATKLKSFVYDKKTKNLLETPLQLGTSYLILSQHCKAWLEEHYAPAEEGAAEKKERLQWIKNGTAPLEANYRTFTYDGKILTVYFAEYQVAPYSEGFFAVPLNLP